MANENLASRLSGRIKYMTEKDAQFARSLVEQRDTWTAKQRKWASILSTRYGPRRNREHLSNQEHTVYAISDGRYVKIGVSRDPYSRIREMQTGHPNQLTLRWSTKTDCRRAAYSLERRLHNRLRRHKVRGEWFEMEVLEVLRERYPRCVLQSETP